MALIPISFASVIEPSASRSTERVPAVTFEALISEANFELSTVPEPICAADKLPVILLALTPINFASVIEPSAIVVGGKPIILAASIPLANFSFVIEPEGI